MGIQADEYLVVWKRIGHVIKIDPLNHLVEQCANVVNKQVDKENSRRYWWHIVIKKIMSSTCGYRFGGGIKECFLE